MGSENKVVGWWLSQNGKSEMHRSLDTVCLNVCVYNISIYVLNAHHIISYTNCLFWIKSIKRDGHPEKEISTLKQKQKTIRQPNHWKGFHSTSNQTRHLKIPPCHQGALAQNATFHCMPVPHKSKAFACYLGCSKGHHLLMAENSYPPKRGLVAPRFTRSERMNQQGKTYSIFKIYMHIQSHIIWAYMSCGQNYFFGENVITKCEGSAIGLAGFEYRLRHRVSILGGPLSVVKVPWAASKLKATSYYSVHPLILSATHLCIEYHAVCMILYQERCIMIQC